jgi:hypothetical protein
MKPGALLCMFAVAAVAAGRARGEPLESEPVEPSAWDERDVDRLGWWVPDFVEVQTGGYVGLVAGGFGYAIFDHVLELSLAYGYTPAFVAGRGTHVLAWEGAVRPFDVRIGPTRLVPIYAGAGGLYALGGDFFVNEPDRYQNSDYYDPTALHWTLHVGVELGFLPSPDSFVERHSAYAELRTIDVLFEALVTNGREIDLHEAVAAGLGYRLAF